MNLTRRRWLSVGGAAVPVALAQDVDRNVQHGTTRTTGRRFGDERDWFFERRFGLFIHWGIYAIPGWHEQHMYRKRWTRDQYRPLAARFHPRRFQPDDWLDIAESAAMGYVCFTAKHIDGFCMWDTRETEFNVMRTPYGRDIVLELADACHRRGMPLELYYSIVDGWNPNYPNAGRPHEFATPQPGDNPDLERYVAFVKRQLRELCTQYGEIHGVWFDANRLNYRDPSVRRMIRELQPRALINNRGFDEGDYGTPERDYDAAVNSAIFFDRPVEACESVGYQSWGYREDEDYHSSQYLIRSMHTIMAKGGNFLLNVGPDADGVLPREAVDLLSATGGWYRSVRESIDDVEPGPRLSAAPALITTRRGHTTYVHLLTPPPTGSVYLHPLDTKPAEATLINTGTKLHCDVPDLPRLFNGKPSRCLRLRGFPRGLSDAAGWVVKLTYSA